MDLSESTSDSDTDEVGTTASPTYTRKDVKKSSGTGWKHFTSIIDSGGNMVCFNCILCLPTSVEIDVKKHVRTNKGKSQKGVFSVSTASTGVCRHLLTEHQIEMASDDAEAGTKGRCGGQHEPHLHTNQSNLRPPIHRLVDYVDLYRIHEAFLFFFLFEHSKLRVPQALV